MNLQHLRCLFALILLPTFGFAQISTNTDDQPPMKFSIPNDAKPAKGGEKFIFKVPTQNESNTDIQADPVNNTPNKEIYTTHFDYPRHQLTVRVNPTSYGGTFSYQTSKFNFAAIDWLGLNLAYRMSASPEYFFESDASYFTAKTLSGTANAFKVQSSEVGNLQIGLRGYKCWIGNTAFSKVCPGVEFFLDQYALLGFSGNTELSMQNAKDIMLGLNLHAQMPLIREMILNGRLGYLSGTGAGQSGALTSQSNRIIYLDTRIDWPIRERRFVDLGLRYEKREAVIEGQISSTLKDKWETSTGQLSVRIGYTWEFGPN